MDISPEYYQYYDLLYSDRTIDLPMWFKFAQEAGDSILDIGCGTGRVLFSLAKLGSTLVGIDISADAVHQAQNKNTIPNISILQANMENFELSLKDFALVFILHNTFLYCLSMESQLETLRSIYKHMKDKGRLIIDISAPPATNQDGRFHLGREFIDAEGNIVQWYLSYTVNFIEQILNCNQIVDTIDPNGIVHRATIRFPQRFVYRQEMELLLKMTGFTLEAIYGDYEYSPLSEHSSKMIFVAVKSNSTVAVHSGIWEGASDA